MGTTNNEPVSPQGGDAQRKKKVFMACIRCRERKASCDGQTPECSRCTRSLVKCEYEAFRKMRGPGKQRDLRGDGIINEDQSPSSIMHGMSSKSAAVQAHLRRIYPSFMHPENAIQAFDEIKRAAQDDQKSPQGFSPLPRQEIIDFMLGNTFDEIESICPIFDLPALHRFNAEQHSVSRIHPAGHPARWAILCTWIAVAMKRQMVPGAEGELDIVVHSYYRNAAIVLPDLIMGAVSMESVQALLFMAAYAGSTEDHQAFIMLGINASRQVEMLSQRMSGVSDPSDNDFQRLWWFANNLDATVSAKYGLTPLLRSR